MTNKKPIKTYLTLTQNRTQEQIKYKYIATKLRSEENYNEIPLYIRNKNIFNFKKAYKNRRNNYKIIPKIIKNRNQTYTLVWPT